MSDTGDTDNTTTIHDVLCHSIRTTVDGGILVTFAINEDFVPQIALLLDAKRRGAVLLLQIVEQ